MELNREPESGGGLKIAYVVVGFPCYSETFVLRELIELERRGVELTIISLRGFSEKIMDDDARAFLPRTLYSPYLFSRGLLRANLRYLVRKPGAYARILGLFISRLFLNPKAFVKSLALFPKSVHFAGLLEERGVTHVHAHFTNYPATAAYVISALTGISFTMTAHAHDIFENQFLLAEKLPRAKRVFAISDYNRRFIMDCCKGAPSEKIEVLHCGLDLSLIPPCGPQGEGDAPLILSVGRMMAIKGFDTLMRATAILRDRGLQFRCTIVGDGPERGRLDRLADELSLHGVVSMVGELKFQEVIDLMRSCRLFVLASRHADIKSGVMDGIPVSLMEAMAMGVPVVSCAVSGIPELVVDGQTGLLVPPDNARRLADAISRLLADDGLRRLVAESGREKVEREFNITGVVDRLLEVFKETV